MSVRAARIISGVGLLFIAATFVVSACDAVNVPSVMSSAESTAPGPATTTYPIVPVTMTDAAHCPRTLGTAAPETIPAREFFGSSSSLGNGKLWVGGLWSDGIILADPRFVDADGAVSMKFGWWRVESGRLQITGTRVDASAPTASGDAPDGYGDAGFQASGVRFPTEGCWAITGTVASTSLTFVTFVIKVPAQPSVAPSQWHL